MPVADIEEDYTSPSCVRGSPMIVEVVLGNRQMHSVYIVCAHTYAAITS